MATTIRWQRSIRHSFSVNSFPTYILVGRDGTILNRYVGEDYLESVLDRIGPRSKKHCSNSPVPICSKSTAQYSPHVCRSNQLEPRRKIASRKLLWNIAAPAAL